MSNTEQPIGTENLDRINKEFIKHPDYVHVPYDEDDEGVYECDYCHDVIDMSDKYAEMSRCKHSYSCQDCQHDSTQNPKQHYGYCIYCILDGTDWDEEWDSWYEVASRGHNVLLNGMMDMFQYRKGYSFDMVMPSYSRVASFQKVYQRGVNIAQTIIFDRDDTKIIEVINKEMNRFA